MSTATTVPVDSIAAQSVARHIHTVFFTLHDPSPEARHSLVEACEKYLRDHEGILSFAVGTKADEFMRAVNVRDFDVSLHVVFRDSAVHDRYQSDPRHRQFVREQHANWLAVRVFDSESC